MSIDENTLPPFAAIIVAAGKGLRVGGDVPKQFRQYRGMPLIRHSVERLSNHGADRICVVIAADCQDIAQEALHGLKNIEWVIGGETRQTSVRNALEYLASTPIQNVLIHDAARPIVPLPVTQRLLEALTQSSGAIPTLPVVDSLSVEDNGMMAGSADRNNLRRVQTPQAFRFIEILAAHRAWNGEPNAGDDAQILRAAAGNVSHVTGDERLKKITFAGDFQAQGTAMRIGQGYDVHALESGEELWLCGIQLDHNKGLSGHSDADVALHAVVDAILGALGDGDIGTHFPPTDPQWKGAASPLFVKHACTLMRAAGYELGNLDLTIVCEAPKIGPHRDKMRARLAEIAGVDAERISVKATTTEKLGFTGREEGIAAQATVLLMKEETS